MSEPLYRIWSISKQYFVTSNNDFYVDKEGEVKHPAFNPKPDNYIIQRCTGEIVNDKYIYEGDIVEHYPNASATIRAVVEFNYGNFEVRDLQGWETLTIEDIDKIIGNNLENPELLLEKEKE